MKLSLEEKAILAGDSGPVMAKIMQTLVRYGELFGAEKLVPVTSEYGHLVTSFGLGVIAPVYELMDEIIASGISAKQKFSMDPRPLDPKVPKGLIQNLVFKKFMYSKQEQYEKQMEKIGLLNDRAFTCAAYFDEVGNTPKRGDILSWAESSAVVYANSVLGARCNRNSGIIELFGSILGLVPYFGLLTDEGRKAKWKIQLELSELPNAQVLGSAIGMKVMEDVPYVFGLDKFLGQALNEENKTYLKNFGAATASNGAVGLYHIDHLTPEAKDFGEQLILPDAQTYVIDDAELARVVKSYPVMWKDREAQAKLCFIGCPHATLAETTQWIQKIAAGLDKHGKTKVQIKTVITTAPDVLTAFEKTAEAELANKLGIVVSYICPLMYMNNPLSEKMPVITNSNKLRTYSSSRFYEDAEILKQIVGAK